MATTDKKVKEKASQLLRRIISKQFFLMNLGILDIYRLLGSTSKQLQKVQLFPWHIPKIQQQLLEHLKKMESLKLSEVEEVDLSMWESLGAKVEDIMEDKYISVQAPLGAPGNLIDVTLVFEGLMPNTNHHRFEKRKNSWRCVQLPVSADICAKQADQPRKGPEDQHAGENHQQPHPKGDQTDGQVP